MTATVAVDVWMRPCALGLGDALDAVRAALPLEDGVRAVTFDRERDFLVAAAVGRARLELLDLVAAPLGVAREHAVDVAGPERGLVAADALTHLDEDVLAVGGIGRDERDAELLLDRGGARLEVGDHLAEVGVVARRGEVLVERLPLLRELVRVLELLHAAADVRRLAVVVVDRRVGHAALQLLVRALRVPQRGCRSPSPSRRSA